jgi:hypothetical protein
MTHYPLLFGFRDLVAGRGFLAGVAVNGRSLLVHDDELGYWMHGVNPGGLSAGGIDAGAAQQAFRETYRTVLFDISADAGDFEEFKAEVTKFFHETSDLLLTEWLEAVEAVREGSVHLDGLTRVKSDRAKLSIDITPLSVDQLEPTVNEADEEPHLADEEPDFEKKAA